MTLGRSLRKAAHEWHSLVARSALLTRLYVATVAAVARRVPSRRLRALIEWALTGQDVAWKPLAFPPRTVVVGKRTAIRLIPHLGEFDQTALFRDALTYEADVFAWLEAHACDRYDAIVDIGANVGVYTVFFDALIKAAPNGRLRRVYAFEPGPEPYRRLLENLRANAASFIDTFAVAVSDQSGFALFHEPEGRLTNGSLSRDFADLFSRPVRSRMTPTLAGASLDALFARHPRVLLKIDAEGFEPQILASMAPVLEKHHPDLLIEVLAGADGQLAALDCLAGYACFQLGADGPVRHQALAANPLNMDWLLTKAPQDIEVAV